MLAALKQCAKSCLAHFGFAIDRAPQEQDVSSLRAIQASNEAALRYLLDEVSELRMLVRALTAASPVRNADIAQTLQSFAFQWDEIGSGKHLLGDPDFDREMCALACRYADMPPEAFAGKTVLDAGCGNGRWSYTFSKLGAKVTAIDQSESAVAELNARWGEKLEFAARRADLLRPLPFDSKFDLVWCYGVAHHTGNTKLAVENVASAVKPGGRLFLMIYGEPRSESEFNEINGYVELRRATRNMSFEQKKSYLEARFPPDLVHGYFDATSPVINDLHRFDEIESWLCAAGFSHIRPTIESRNHHIVADRLGQDA